MTHLRVAPHNYSTDRWTVDYLDVAVWVDASLGNDFASPEEAAAAALVRYGKITPFKPN